MSKYDPPQCQICADHWIKEGRPLGNFLRVSRGGHIPGVVHDQTSSGGRGEPRSQPIITGRSSEETRIDKLEDEIKELGVSLNKANKEIKDIKAELERRNSGERSSQAGGSLSG